MHGRLIDELGEYMEQEKIEFEDQMKRLEEIVLTLEKGEAPLDTLLSLYTEGAGLVKACNELLDNAEQTIARLSKGADGLPQESPFEAEGD